MSLFDAKPPDEREIRRGKLIKSAVITIVVLAVLAGPLLYIFHNYFEERATDKFFAALEQKDYKRAFGIWNADADWEQHADRYKDYTFGEFQLDWGPPGKYGEIKSHEVLGSVTPRSKLTEATGVVVAVRVNGRGEPECLWVDRKTKAIGFSPLPCMA